MEQATLPTIRVNKPEETPDTPYEPRTNPKKNAVLSIYERHLRKYLH